MVCVLNTQSQLRMHLARFQYISIIHSCSYSNTNKYNIQTNTNQNNWYPTKDRSHTFSYGGNTAHSEIIREHLALS